MTAGAVSLVKSFALLRKNKTWKQGNTKKKLRTFHNLKAWIGQRLLAIQARQTLRKGKYSKSKFQPLAGKEGSSECLASQVKQRTKRLFIFHLDHNLFNGRIFINLYSRPMGIVGEEYEKFSGLGHEHLPVFGVIKCNVLFFIVWHFPGG